MADKLVYIQRYVACAACALVIILCVSAAGWHAMANAAESNFQVAILVSKHVKPYMEAASGLGDCLQEQGKKSQVILLNDKDLFERQQLIKVLQESQSFEAAVAIGPQAMKFLWTIPEPNIPFLFSMVLHPDQLRTETSPPLCGVSLFIPVDMQLQSIEESLPGQTRIGLLFHPDHNRKFFDQAVRAAKDSGKRIVPLAIADQGNISDVLSRGLRQVDALWLIPDRVLTSQKVVEYIIKQALYANVPVVGYNRFFHQSGAAVSFVFDYSSIGRQTGQLLMRRLSGRDCRVVSAKFEVWENERIFDLLGLEDE